MTTEDFLYTREDREIIRSLAHESLFYLERGELEVSLMFARMAYGWHRTCKLADDFARGVVNTERVNQ